MYHVVVKNFEIARLFYEMAALLEVKNESRFRMRAYQRAAQTLESLTEDVAAVAARGQLTTLPGIGPDLAARIDEYLATGRLARLDAMRSDQVRTVTLLNQRGDLPFHVHHHRSRVQQHEKDEEEQRDLGDDDWNHSLVLSRGPPPLLARDSSELRRGSPKRLRREGGTPATCLTLAISLETCYFT